MPSGKIQTVHFQINISVFNVEVCITGVLSAPEEICEWHVFVCLCLRVSSTIFMLWEQGKLMTNSDIHAE